MQKTILAWCYPTVKKSALSRHYNACLDRKTKEPKKRIVMAEGEIVVWGNYVGWQNEPEPPHDELQPVLKVCYAPPLAPSPERDAALALVMAKMRRPAPATVAPAPVDLEKIAE